jgi:NADH-quinone oxidoreductase subunit G
MLADEMGTPINLPTVTAAREEFNSLGNWEARSSFTPVSPKSVSASGNQALLSSWRLLLDAGSLQDGENNLAGTVHPSVAVISENRAASLGVKNGDLITVTSHGSITLPCEINAIEENSVWIPRNSIDSKVIATLGVASGPVSVVKA